MLRGILFIFYFLHSCFLYFSPDINECSDNYRNDIRSMQIKALNSMNRDKAQNLNGYKEYPISGNSYIPGWR